MILAVYLLQPFTRNMGIDLGSGNIGMSQHDLDGAKIGPVFQQMGGKAVAEHMRAQLLAYGCLAPIRL